MTRDDDFTKDGNTEMRILRSMATDLVVLSRLESRWEGKMGPLSSSYANLIGSWSVDNYKELHEPPKHGLRLRFESWARGKSDAEIANVEKIFCGLHNLGEDPEHSSEQI